MNHFQFSQENPKSQTNFLVRVFRWVPVLEVWKNSELNAFNSSVRLDDFRFEFSSQSTKDIELQEA